MARAPSPALPPPRPSANDPVLPKRLRFGAFRLLADERRLLRDGVEVPLGARAFDVLCALAQRPDRLVTKDELLAEVWHGRVVEESNLHVQVSQARRAVGADAIATVPGLGYRFARAVVAEDPAPAAPAGPAQAARGEARGRRLSVMVLPFVEPGAAPGDAGFAGAVTDDVIAQVARIRGATVIAAPASPAFRGTDVDATDTARELGVRYVLQGRLDRDGPRVELAARLTDAGTRAVVWADAIEVDRADARGLRHDLVARLATALDLQLAFAEASRVARLPAASIAADDLVMLARAGGGWNLNRAHFLQTLALYERALGIDPDCAPALAGRALALAADALAWPGPDIDATLARAEADALRAIALDSLDPLPYTALSIVRQQQYRLDDAFDAVRQALAVGPNDLHAIGWCGELHKYRAEWDEARAHAMRCVELSPRDPLRWAVQFRLGSIALLEGDAAQAAAWLERSFTLYPYWLTASFLAAACASLGRTARLAELSRIRAEGAEAADTHNAWNRVSNHPVFLERCREHLFGPLLRCGAVPDPTFPERWIERQRRGGAPA